MIAFNLACYASVTGRMVEAKERLRNAISLTKTFVDWRLTMRIWKPLWDWITHLH